MTFIDKKKEERNIRNGGQTNAWLISVITFRTREGNANSGLKGKFGF